MKAYFVCLLTWCLNCSIGVFSMFVVCCIYPLNEMLYKNKVIAAGNVISLSICIKCHWSHMKALFEKCIFFFVDVLFSFSLSSWLFINPIKKNWQFYEIEGFQIFYFFDWLSSLLIVVKKKQFSNQIERFSTLFYLVAN